MLIVLADAGGYVDDAVDRRSTRAPSTCRRRWATPPRSRPRSTAQIGDASIGVAVFSDNAALEASGPEIVAGAGGGAPGLRHDHRRRRRRPVGRLARARAAARRCGSPTRPSRPARTLEDALTETVQGVVAASDSPPVTAADGVGGARDRARDRRRGRRRRRSCGVDRASCAAAAPAAGRRAPLPDAVRAQVQTLRCAERGVRRGGRRRAPDRRADRAGHRGHRRQRHAALRAAGRQGVARTSGGSPRSSTATSSAS